MNSLLFTDVDNYFHRCLTVIINILVNEGKVHLKPLISKTFAFKDYLKAYQYIDDNRETTMKVIINVSEK